MQKVTVKEKVINSLQQMSQEQLMSLQFPSERNDRQGARSLAGGLTRRPQPFAPSRFRTSTVLQRARSSPTMETLLVPATVLSKTGSRIVGAEGFG